MIEHDGKTTTFAELSKQVGVGAETLRQRYKNGARGADLVKNTRQTIEHDGARISFEALSKQVGVSVDTLRKRYRKGKRGACLVAAPKTDKKPFTRAERWISTNCLLSQVYQNPPCTIAIKKVLVVTTCWWRLLAGLRQRSSTSTDRRLR